MRIIRRGVVTFDQVSHIRDNSGLQGRPVSSAKDGNLLGIAAGRALCRSIDKRAFKDDPIHYADGKYAPRTIPDSQSVSHIRPGKIEDSFLSMDYSHYVSWHMNTRKEDDPCPTIQHLVLRD